MTFKTFFMGKETVCPNFFNEPNIWQDCCLKMPNAICQ